MNNFYYALSLMETMFGVSIEEDDFAEIALVGWNLIGNKHTRLYRYHVCLDDCSDGVQLPCNCEMIEAVTTDFEDWNYTTNDTPNGDINSAFIESYIEHRKGFRNPLYASGKFIKYERVGDKLYFDRPHGHVNILYRGIILDDNDLPEITDKEALALATYTAWVIKYREGLLTNNASIIQIANTLKLQWDTRCDQARGDHYLSQNEWDQVLDAKVNWDRKQFNKSFKMYH